jgi:non-specific serine/threonine protein kinase/serine/threonine-protein kinase
VVCIACALALALDPDTPRAIGPYRLLHRIGEGGMGEVWAAEQIEPVRRRVAIKLIKAGMDTKQVIARFGAERQALAMMDHPCISKVYDAGETEEGRPYFVMEQVSGLPITEYSDRHRLTTGERLALFLQVCGAVQHAHQRAIIHRDLKPSNVLVSFENGIAVPKVIDFGVAKATAQPLTEKTLYTEVGVLIGTPEYMSPEQADPAAQEVDTRTDVYALGVILYELLVGSLPFEPKALREAGFDGIRRMIREVEPPKPSTRLKTLDGPLSSDAAKRRQVDLPTLRRQLTGELDWITMKALDKDRDRRYGSPAELAADLRRHLRHEPVLAGPPSPAYRARKFVRRHRVGVAAAIVATIALGTFAAAMVVQARRTARESEAKRHVSQFLAELFKVSNPSEARGGKITARELLDKGVVKIRESLQDDPQVRAELMSTMGTVYLGLGLYDQAEPLLREALDTRRRVLGPEHPDTLGTAVEMGRLLHAMMRDNESEALLAETLEIQKRVRGPEHPETLRTMGDLARAYWGQQRSREAEALFRELLAIQTRVLGPEDVETLRSMHGLGLAVQNQGRFEEAEAIFKETLALRKRVLGPEHPHVLNTMMHLAFSYKNQGRDREAEALTRELLDIGDRVLGPRHFDMLHVRLNLAAWAAEEGRRSEALDDLRAAVENGFSDVKALLDQPAFRAFAGSPDFETIVAAARANAVKAEAAK